VANPAAIFDASGNVNFSGTGATIYDPNTGNANGTSRAVFPNDTIPQAASIRSADYASANRYKGFLNNSGLTATNNYVANNTAQFNRDDFDVKVNYTPTQKLMIFGKYSLSKSFIFDPPALGPRKVTPPMAGSWATRFPEFRALASRQLYHQLEHVAGCQCGVHAPAHQRGEHRPILGAFGLNTLHIPGTNGPCFSKAASLLSRSPASPTWEIQYGNPFLFRDNQYVFNSNLGWTKGRHDLRFGFEYGRSGINHFQPQGGAFQTARGSFRFTGNATALNAAGAASANQYNAIASSCSVCRARLARRSKRQSQLTSFPHLGAYARDRWQVTSKLTVTYGLRWERYPLPPAITPVPAFLIGRQPTCSLAA